MMKPGSRGRRLAGRRSRRCRWRLAARPEVVRSQDFGDFWAREFLRQVSAGSQDLADLRARQLEPFSRPVRAALRRGQRAARAAVERRIKPERRHAEIARLEPIEDALRRQRLVVLADAGMVAPDDDLVDAVVLAGDGVEDRFARARVPHRRGERREDRPILRVVLLHQHAVGVESHRRRHVVLLRLADERMDHQAVAHLERNLRQVLVRAVDRIARLESGDGLPPELGDARAQLARRQAIFEEGTVVAERQHPDAAADELCAGAPAGTRRRDAPGRRCRRPRATPRADRG